jgi:DNA repair exonuclease SbcCD nuclease subunit
MKYKIVCIADIHWGALDADKQRKELSIISEYLSEHKVDLVVICGDYFDHKLLLNSQASLQSIDFMSELRKMSKDKGFKIRIFDGTRSHDYDQLEVFMPFDDGDTFRVFRHTAQEETLPELKCLYAPDENMTTEEWYQEYGNSIMDKDNDIMFFHGNFDNMLGGLLVNDETEQPKNVVFEYSVLSRIFSVMIGGHWHDADNIGNMYYTRSVNRWKFGEDRPKGFIVCDYDTDKRSYKITRVDNQYTDEYKTYLIDTSIFTTIEDYNSLSADVDRKIKEDPDIHVKIKIVVTNDSNNNKVFIDHIKNKYSMDRRVKISLENKFVKQKKKEKSKHLSDSKDKYSFLFNSSTKIEEKFIEFIKLTKGIELDINDVKEVLSNYIKEEER